MSELKILRTASIVDAVKNTENANYSIRYQYEEYNSLKNLQAIYVEVAQKQSEGQFVNIGNIKYSNEQISMSGFPYSEKTATFIQEITEIIDEIKLLIQ